MSKLIIEDGILKECTGRGGDIVIPTSVTAIGDKAFSSYRGLTSVSIPDSVTSIGDWAFSDCTQLTVYTPVGSFAGRNAKENCIPVKNLP